MKPVVLWTMKSPGVRHINCEGSVVWHLVLSCGSVLMLRDEMHAGFICSSHQNKDSSNSHAAATCMHSTINLDFRL